MTNKFKNLQNIINSNFDNRAHLIKEIENKRMAKYYQLLKQRQEIDSQIYANDKEAEKEKEKISAQSREKTALESQELNKMREDFKLLHQYINRNYKQSPFEISNRSKMVEVIKEIKNELLHAVVIIYDNGKPKNKYGVSVLGTCFFGGDDTKLRDYGINPYILNTYSGNERENIAIKVKDFDTKEKALKCATDYNLDDSEIKNMYSKIENMKERLLTDEEFELSYYSYLVNYYETEVSRGKEEKEYKKAAAIVNELELK